MGGLKKNTIFKNTTN